MDAIDVLHLVPILHRPRRGPADEVAFDHARVLVEPRRAESRDLVGLSDAGVDQVAYDGGRWKRLTARMAMDDKAGGAPLSEAQCITYLEGGGNRILNTPLLQVLRRSPLCASRVNGTVEMGRPQDGRIPRSRRIADGAEWAGPAAAEFIRRELLFVEGTVYRRMEGPARFLRLSWNSGAMNTSLHDVADSAEWRFGSGEDWFCLGAGRNAEQEALTLAWKLPPGRFPSMSGEAAVPDICEDVVLTANALAVRVRRSLMRRGMLDGDDLEIRRIVDALAPHEMRGFLGELDAAGAEDAMRLVSEAETVLGWDTPGSVAMAAEYAREVALPRLRARFETAPDGDDALAMDGLGTGP